MSAVSLAPVVVAIVSAVLLGLLRTLMRPAFTVALLTVVATAVAGATFILAVVLVLIFVSRLEALEHHLGWCQHLAQSHDLPTTVGIGAAAAVVVMSVQGIRHIRKRRLPFLPAGDQSLVVLPSESAAAYALPGKPGRVVVTVGMLRALDGAERRALLAHEEAHLQHGHHRYVSLSSLAAAMMPVLAPLARRVRYATERWADEAAALAIGDRVVVARALARASLAANETSKPATALSISDVGAVARVRCLLGQESPNRFGALQAITGVALAVIAVSSLTIQTHQLVGLLIHICEF